MLKLPVSRTEQALKQFLRGAPANILVRYRYDAGLAASVREAEPDPAAAWSSFVDLAAEMRMPPSTLRHRLDEEGQSYAGIKDDIRRDLAIDLLLNTRRRSAKSPHSSAIPNPAPSIAHSANGCPRARTPSAGKVGLRSVAEHLPP